MKSKDPLKSIEEHLFPDEPKTLKVKHLEDHPLYVKEYNGEIKKLLDSPQVTHSGGTVSCCVHNCPICKNSPQVEECSTNEWEKELAKDLEMACVEGVTEPKRIIEKIRQVILKDRQKQREEMVEKIMALETASLDEAVLTVWRKDVLDLLTKQ